MHKFLAQRFMVPISQGKDFGGPKIGDDVNLTVRVFGSNALILYSREFALQV